MSHWIASVISSSPARRGPDRPHRVVHAAVEQVDAGECEVRHRFGRLLDEAAHVAVGSDLGDAELTGILDVCEQDLCREARLRVVQLLRGLEGVDELLDALLDEVVTEIDDEVVVAQEVACDQHAVRETEWGILLDVGDASTPRFAGPDRFHDLVARVTDDDPHLGDPRGDDVLQAVEENRLVRHGDQLLGASVRDGS